MRKSRVKKTATFLCDDLWRAPTTKEQLREYVGRFLGVHLSSKPVIEGHNAPIDYLWHTYSVDLRKDSKTGDCIVCANRGGGKTLLGAAATILDCVFKPNCQVRILSGSENQALKMYEYFQSFLTMGFSEIVKETIKRPRQKTIFLNGASVEVLTQSEKSVRGPHVHKLRCDEIELFKKDVYEAAQYTTMSGNGIIGALESISTMHKPYGIMKQAIIKGQKAGTPIFLWSLWDVIEQCKNRICKVCPIWSICGGIAQKANGYFRIDDAISQYQRSSKTSYNREQICGKLVGDKISFDGIKERRY